MKILRADDLKEFTKTSADRIDLLMQAAHCLFPDPTCPTPDQTEGQ
jgi:hypothetical protein